VNISATTSSEIYGTPIFVFLRSKHFVFKNLNDKFTYEWDVFADDSSSSSEESADKNEGKSIGANRFAQF